MINYLMIAYNDPDVDWDNIRAIINCPSRYISNSLMERADNLSDLLSLVKKEAPRKARAVRELIGLINLIRKKAKNAATIRETMEYIWNEADLDQWVKDNCHYYYQDEDEYYDINISTYQHINMQTYQHTSMQTCKPITMVIYLSLIHI